MGLEAAERDHRGHGVERSSHDLTLAERIIDLVLRHRRLVPEHQHLSQAITNRCRAPHLDKIEVAICAQRPVHLILPAFPGKSSNPTKTLGVLPDLGEALAIGRLQSICDDVRAVYPPGARVTICSDGRVFSDLVLISESDVDAYKIELHRMIRESQATSIDHYDLDDAYPDADYAVMREELLVTNGSSLRELRARVREGDPDTLTMFNGIHRFLFEDYVVQNPRLSRNSVRELSKVAAYRVVQRSNAWSRFVEAQFPHALRLSIHPQRSDSRKIGMMLVPCADVWGTPWHNVVVVRGEAATLMKRAKAEELGAQLVNHNGRASHYVLADTQEATQ
jgi:pyoverdine/dityrosine biosynthesis protein Dit1